MSCASHPSVSPGADVRTARVPRPREDEPLFDPLVDAADEADAAAAERELLDAPVGRADTRSTDGDTRSTDEDARRPRRLTDRERAMLEFERQWWRHAGSKEQAIRETFDLSATRYYRVLNALLDVPAAAEFDPLVVGRLRRLRASRARRRAGR